MVKMTSLLLGMLMTISVKSTVNDEHVVLLHGLCRTAKSMIKMERSLSKCGYRVMNVDYPSRKQTIIDLSNRYVGDAVNACRANGADQIHFVAHSLGGILIRDYLSRNKMADLGRVVMLGPPNKGSEIVDKLGQLKLFEWMNGAAGKDLGTENSSVLNRLGPVDFPLGIIAGDRSINWINSAMIYGKDDGKVSVENTKVAGMTDHITLHVTHPYIMKNKESIRQTIEFLRNGRFDHK